MSRSFKLCAAVLASSVAALVASGPAAAADTVVPFDNYTLSGTLGLKKLKQTIALPGGSTFNGSANLTTGQLSGHAAIPEFTSTIKVLGIPTRVTTRLDEADPVSGTVKLNANGTVSVRSTTSAILRVRRLRLGLLSVPTTCRTAEPVQLALNYDGPFTTSLSFTGTTTIPRLTGCGPLGPTLGALLSGPGNTYSLAISPPAG